MSADITMEDRSGRARSLREYREALAYYTAQLVAFDVRDPGGVMNAPVVIELLKAVIAHLERRRDATP